jgi:hypothetical protein
MQTYTRLRVHLCKLTHMYVYTGSYFCDECNRVHVDSTIHEQVVQEKELVPPHLYGYG